MLEIRPITPDEVPKFRACMAETFGLDLDVDPSGEDRLRALIDPARTYCAFDGELLVASAATYSFTLAVCGGTVRLAGLSGVSVRAPYRRRGLLRRMISAHLADGAARGEPVAGLWASEGSIYGRFGFGVAVEGDELTLAPDDGLARGELDTVAQLDEAAARATLPALYARAQPTRPGMIARTEAWWHFRRFEDRADLRRGRSPRRTIVTRRGGELTGYAVFRQHLAWDQGQADGTLDLEEVVALDPIAEATLYHHVTHTDLFPKVTYWNAPVDALAPWLARDRRNVTRGRRCDTLWLRICDVAAALGARRYSSDGALRFAVEGVRWELVVDGGVARCAATTAAPELELELAALASIYLGQVAPSLLARTGAIRGSLDGLTRADRMFSWPIAPWCAEIF